jgi:hypothetical protein
MRSDIDGVNFAAQHTTKVIQAGPTLQSPIVFEAEDYDANISQGGQDWRLVFNAATPVLRVGGAEIMASTIIPVY